MKEFKFCNVCGRKMEYRKAWAKNWSEVKYCSDQCRKNKSKAQDSQFEKDLMNLLNQRGPNKTICPSEILNEADKQNPKIMEEVRQAARRLVQKGLIQILQMGQVVDPSEFKGPIRLKLK